MTTPPSIVERWPELRRLQLEGQFVDSITLVGGAEGLRAELARAASSEAYARIVRLLRCGGSPRAAYLLAQWLWRRRPNDPWARATWFPYLAQRNTLEGHLFLEREGVEVPEGVDDELALNWMHARAAIWNDLRMFDEAMGLGQVCRERWPDHPWSLTIEPLTLAAADRRTEALAGIEATLARFPRSALPHQLRVHWLALLDRPQEALGAADEALALVQEDSVARLAASLLVEAGRRREAIAYLERARALAPLADRPTRLGLETSILECLYLDERFDEAAEVARRIVAELPRRASSPERRSYPERVLDASVDPALRARPRTVLPVPFIAQAHNTCSPASLASIAGSWTMPGSHDEIAAEICTEGTPPELSREWAERHGWTTAEFLPDVPSTLELIRRRVPFAIHTSWLGGAHSQTVMGFDERTGLAVVREPSVPRFIEYMIESRWRVLPMHALVGLVMVPRDSPAAAALAEIALPGREQMTLAHAMRLGWRKGDDEAAERAYRELSERFPDDDVTLLLRADRAQRQGREEEALTAIERLAERHPDDDQLARRLAITLRAVGHEERADEVLARRIATRRAAPGLLLDQAWTLAMRGQPAAAVERIAVRAAGRGHKLAECLPFLAQLRQRDGRHEEAERLLRITSFLAPDHQPAHEAWIETLQRLGRLEPAIEELARRHAEAREGRELLRPLAAALWVAGRRDESMATVERAVERWPDDLGLAVLRLRHRRAIGRLAEAEADLAALEGRIERIEWLGERAGNAEARRDHPEAMRAYRAMLEIDPASPQAWHGLLGLARHPHAVEGLAEELEAHVARTPAAWPVAEALASLYEERDPGRAVAALERHLEASPRSSAGWLRLARLLRGIGRLDEATRAAERTCELHPYGADGWSLLADLRLDAGDAEGSRQAALRALDLGTGDGVAVDRVLRTLPGLDERRSWLRERWRRALEEPRSPTALQTLAWSSSSLPADEVCGLIATCPTSGEFESVHASAATLLARERRFADALALLERLAVPYAHSERLRSLRCEILVDAKDWAATIAAAEAWLAASPHVTAPYRFLVAAHRSLEQVDRCAEVLRRWADAAPHDVTIVRWLASTLCELDRTAEAGERLAAAWERSHDVDLGWLRLDIHASRNERDAYLSFLEAFLPRLDDAGGSIENGHQRLPGLPWIRSAWWTALRTADDRSPPGVRALWGLHAIARDTPRWVLREMLRRFQGDEARADVVQALAYAGCNREHAALTRLLVRRHPDLARRRPGTLTTIADGLWVAGQVREIPSWLAGWERRTDLLAEDLRVVSRILDACGEHRAAADAARRGLSLAGPDTFGGLHAALAVALARLGRFDEARMSLQTVVESGGDEESAALAEWGLAAFALLERPGTPDAREVRILASDKARLSRSHDVPIVDSLARAVGEELLRRGARRRDVRFLPSRLDRLSTWLRHRHRRSDIGSQHMQFDLLAPIHRLLGLDRCRYR